jgi:hypothetical protein
MINEQLIDKGMKEVGRGLTWVGHDIVLDGRKETTKYLIQDS